MKSPQHVRAFLNKHNLNDRESNEKSVLQIILHPEWNTYDLKADADLAIIVLTDRIEFQDFQPICLPPASHNEITGLGTIIGWRKFDNHSSNTFVARNGKCLAIFPQIKDIITDRTFCGISKHESDISCDLGEKHENSKMKFKDLRFFFVKNFHFNIQDSNEDNASGFYIQDSSETWSIYGILSVSVNRCQDTKISLFTNVGKFVPWIKKVMKKTKEVVWNFVTFECTRGSE